MRCALRRVSNDGDKAADDLYFGLKGKVKELVRVGDCVAPRDAQAAIREGSSPPARCNGRRPARPEETALSIRNSRAEMNEREEDFHGNSPEM